jgi:anti-sigma factor RsiW
MTAMDRSHIDHAYAEEHGLVEAYLRDRLSESEREAFEAHYFACETCLARLETASDFREGMLQAAAEDTACWPVSPCSPGGAGSPWRVSCCCSWRSPSLC